MTHHKRGKPKNARAGCLMCKPNKQNGASKTTLQVSKTGFGALRDKHAATEDLEAHRGLVEQETVELS